MKLYNETLQAKRIHQNGQQNVCERKFPVLRIFYDLLNGVFKKNRCETRSWSIL